MNQCPPVEQLSAFVEDRLEGDVRHLVEVHVESCAQCQSTLQQICVADVPAELVGPRQDVSKEPDNNWSQRAKRLVNAVRDANVAGSNIDMTMTAQWEAALSTPHDTKSIADDASRSEGAFDETSDGDKFAGDRVRVVRGRGGTSHRIDPPHLVLDDYEVVSEIARGGMGVVYKAWDTGLKCHVALKTIRAGEFAGQEHIDRFQREAEATAKLQHPGIVRVHRVGKSAGLHYFTMDFIEGPTLSDMIKKKPLDEKDATRLTIEICEAIEHAHQHGVLHRDLKPSNVLTDRSGRALVTDFGLAKCMEYESDFSRTGQALGTPSYMPPEQAAGRREEIGFQSDVYSIGALLYHLLTGRPPFIGESHHEVLDQVFNDEPMLLTKLNPIISKDLNTICLKCLHKDRSRRYISAAALRDDLRRFSEGFPIQARRVSSFERTWRLCRRNRIVATLILVTVLTMGIGVLATFHKSTQVSQTFMARLDSARDRLDSEIESAEFTDQLSHDDLVPGRVGMDADKLNAALDEYERVLSDWQAYYGKDLMDERRSHEVATALYRVGQASRLLGDFNRSESAFKMAIKKFQQLSTDSPSNVLYPTMLGTSLDYLGELYRDHDQSELAELAYLESLDVLSRTQETFPGDHDSSLELARTQNNFGLLLERSGQAKQADLRYAKSEGLLRELLTNQPANVECRRDLARTLINIGQLQRTQHSYDRAKAKYEDAIEVLETLVSDDAGNRRLEFLLAVTERNLGFVLYDKLGDPKSGETWLNKARRRFEELPSKIPEYQFNLVICLINLTSLHGQYGGKEGFADCKSLYEESFQKLNALTEQHPNTAEYESWMGVILGNGAAIALADDNVEVAIQRTEKAIDYQSSAYEEQPQNHEYKSRLMNHHRFIMSILLQRDALEASSINQALNHLEAAIELGFRDVNDLMSNDLYLPIRSETRFMDAVKRLESIRDHEPQLP